jgi:hypothetical protein
MKVRIAWPARAGVSGEESRGTWLPMAIQQELEDIALTRLDPNPLDSASLATTAQALESTGWIRNVETIRRQPDGTVTIRARWRNPGCVVRFGDKDILVSTEGELLPLAYPIGTAGQRRVLLNPYAEPPSAAGAEWTGGDVQAGLALLGLLYQNESVWQQVQAIDLSQYVKSKRLVIITDQGNKVIWGQAPGDFAAGEPPDSTKLKWLLYLRKSPDFARRIDAGKPMIDVSNPRGILIDGVAAEGDAEIAGTTPAKPEPAKPAPTKPEASKPKTSGTKKAAR